LESNFIGINGPFILSYEFRAPVDDFHEAQHKAEQNLVDKMHPDDRARDLKVEEIVLGSHQKARKDIIQVEQPLCFSNLSQKILSRSN
jgi:hypothetical protein